MSVKVTYQLIAAQNIAISVVVRISQQCSRLEIKCRSIDEVEVSNMNYNVIKFSIRLSLLLPLEKSMLVGVPEAIVLDILMPKKIIDSQTNNFKS